VYTESLDDASRVVYTDYANSYQTLPKPHESVRHSVGEYVRGKAHTNGMEPHWAMLKRGYEGVHHQMSPKHLRRYVDEFSGRHNRRPLDTAYQISAMVTPGMDRRLPYAELMADQGLS
jgi:hypothetical protein